jgi:hypothetical protein
VHYRIGISLFLYSLVSGFLTNSAQAADRPRLVVVVSVDQFPYEYLERFQQGLSKDGFFRRVFEQGAVYSNCHHAHAFTLTGPGHSVLLTGTFPSATGIVGNDWFDRRTSATVYCVSDNDKPLVGTVGGKGGISPKNLLVNTLGDTLKLSAGDQAKVYGVAMKDRAAVLMAGHLADGVYWFDDQSGNWITSLYYRRDLPGYIRNLNEGYAAQAFLGKSWNLLLEPDKYQQFVPDDNTFESKAGTLGRTFPHPLPDLAGPAYYKAMTLTPYGNDLTLLAARTILQAEKLGQDEVPDLLVVNLSSNDYVGHSFGPQSLEVQDMFYRTDRQLGEFVKFIEDQMHGQPWVLALSSDHGVGPIPEYAASLGLPAARGPLGDLKGVQKRLEENLQRHLGVPAKDGRYVQQVEETEIYLNRELPELAGERFGQAQRIVRDALLELPAIAGAITRDDLLAGGDVPGLVRQFRLSFNPKRSGDVLYVLAPYNIPAGGAAATHGSPWRYDTHVPLLLLGSGVRPGKYTQMVSPAALAPTLARLLKVEDPPACVVDALDEALLESSVSGTKTSKPQ